MPHCGIWLVGEMVNTLPSQGNIYGFEPRTSHHMNMKLTYVGFFLGIIFKEVIIMKIVMIIGSMRKNSFNRQLAEYTEKMIGDRAEIQYLEYADIPFMNQDIEFPAPEAISRVRDMVKEADGIWFFTPEYNSSYPGVLKNLMDWLSRPLVPGDYDTVVMRNKKVAVSGVAGKSAAAGSRAKLKELLGFMNCTILEAETGISLTPESWTSDKLVLSDEQSEHIRKQVEAFVELVSE